MPCRKVEQRRSSGYQDKRGLIEEAAVWACQAQIMASVVIRRGPPKSGPQNKSSRQTAEARLISPERRDQSFFYGRGFLNPDMPKPLAAILERLCDALPRPDGSLRR